MRIFFLEPPKKASIREASASEIDIRHGEWAFFEIGRIISDKYFGDIQGPTALDDGRLRKYEHNVASGSLSFEVRSFDDPKNAFLLGHRPEYPNVWNLKLVISADDVVSMQVEAIIDMTKIKNPVALNLSDSETSN
jgi:hypothetical protein